MDAWHQREHQRTCPPVLPKGVHLAPFSSFDLQAVEDKLNNRPRKRLGWATPAEVRAGSHRRRHCCDSRSNPPLYPSAARRSVSTCRRHGDPRLARTRSSVRLGATSAVRVSGEDSCGQPDGRPATVPSCGPPGRRCSPSSGAGARCAPAACRKGAGRGTSGRLARWPAPVNGPVGYMSCRQGAERPHRRRSRPPPRRRPREPPTRALVRVVRPAIGLHIDDSRRVRKTRSRSAEHVLNT